MQKLEVKQHEDEKINLLIIITLIIILFVWSCLNYTYSICGKDWLIIIAFIGIIHRSRLTQSHNKDWNQDGLWDMISTEVANDVFA